MSTTTTDPIADMLTRIRTVMRGRGIVILSTSRGLMTGDKAKAEKVGGELICKVY
jgi:small subunit ribosomal protein S8